jgi:hypothetical protein
MDAEATVTPELRVFMLGRLERFAALAASPTVAELGSVHRLARHAVLSAYRDCAALGLAEDATAVLDRVRGRATQAA